MTVKLLRAPEGDHDSCIVAIDGQLQVIDPPKRCRGYQCGCICPRCLRREQHARLARSVSTTPAVVAPSQPWQPRPARQAA